MFKKLMKNKKAQNTAEYAILISLVVAGIIAMQTYAQRALQARVRDAAHYLADQTTLGGYDEVQYEPYYLQTNYLVNRSGVTGQKLGANGSTLEYENSSRSRATGGYQKQIYNGFNLVNGV
jgi:Flp pilus assembly pilin Flp